MEMLTIGQMIKKVEAWIDHWAKTYDIYDPCYRIEKTQDQDGNPIFRLYHDGEINSIINEYRNDGNFKIAGSQFERLTDNTNWFNEPESSSVEYFCFDFGNFG